MLPKRRSEWPCPAFWLCVALVVAAPELQAEKVILHLKNGDRISGTVASQTTNSVTVTNLVYGTVQVPVAEIDRREVIPEPPVVPVAPVVVATNAPPAATNAVAAAPVPARPPKEAPGPIEPANPEAKPIAATPSHWKHDLRFGLNLRYSTRDSQEFSLIAKSTYAKKPLRHIFDVNFRYGEIEGDLAANSLAGSHKAEFQFSPRTYMFSFLGGGYDEIRGIDFQYEAGPGLGMELLKLTNFVWKTELGLNFQQQHRSDDTRNSLYSVRIAEIVAWRIWEKLTADAKLEFFPDIRHFGEYRLRLESTLRYPVSKTLSLNLDVIDLYDSRPPQGIPANDLQVRSSIGVTF